MALYVVNFCDFLRFCGVWSDPRQIIRTLFFYEKKQKKIPGASPHEEHGVKTSASNVHVQQKIWMLP